MKYRNTNLLQGSIPYSLVAFSLPILLSNLFQQLYNTADTMIVGHMLGDQALAAVGACSSLFETSIGFALGFGNGFAIPVANAYGAGEFKRLRQSVVCSIVIGLLLTVGLPLLILPCLRPLLQLMNTPAAVINQSYSYISVIIGLMIVFFAYNLCSAIFRAVGNSTAPLYFLIFSSLLNIVLDILLIRFGMGVQGTAIATAIAQGISSILCIVYICKKVPDLVPKKDDFRPDLSLWKEPFLQGISMGSMYAVVHIGSMVVQTTINPLGASVIAGHISGRKIYNLLLLPIVTIPTALATFVSQNLGANQHQRIRIGVRIGNSITCIYSLVSVMISFAFGHTLISLVSGSSDPVVLNIGFWYLSLNTVFYVALTFLMNYRYALQGLGYKSTSLVSSGIELIGKILFALFIIPQTGYLGIILCEPFLWIVMCIHITICYRKALRKL